MSAIVVAIASRPDGKLRVEVSPDGMFFRYRVDEWTAWPADHPIAEAEPGYWAERHLSGVFSSLDDAMKGAMADYQVIPETPQ